MSTTTLPNRLPDRLPNQLSSRVPAPPRDVVRPGGRTRVTGLAAVGAGLWAAAVRVGVWTGRLTTWFVAEPGRVRAALVGVLTCAAIGSAVGVAGGVVAARIVRLMLGIVAGP